MFNANSTTRHQNLPLHCPPQQNKITKKGRTPEINENETDKEVDIQKLEPSIISKLVHRQVFQNDES